MAAWEVLVLFAAGIVGGLAGSIAGLASVSTYPALLFIGLPPVSANVTNTVALVFNGIGSVSGSLPELRGQRNVLVRLVPIAAIGGAAGAALLLTIPAEGFEQVVPLLLGLAAVAIALPHRTGADDRPPSRRRNVVLGFTVFAICVYGGFFGAAAGVLLLAVFLRVGARYFPAGAGSLAHANATKNVVLGVANGVAAVMFMVLASVSWGAVIPMSLGCLVGSRLGPVIVRHAPATPIRLLIAASGLALAVKLGFDAYR